MFLWTESMRVDDGPIDEEHRTLLTIANHVIELQQPHKDAEDLKLAIKELYDYVHYHFEREIKMMREVGYPDVEDVTEKHDRIIADMNTYLRSSKHVGELLSSFRVLVNCWVIDHIMQEDKKFHSFLIAKRKQDDSEGKQ